MRENPTLQKFSGEKLKILRNNKRWTQEDLAKKLGVRSTAIGNYERGERPLNQDILFQLSDIFDVSINYFFPTTVLKTSIQNIYDQLHPLRQKKVYSFAENELAEQNKENDNVIQLSDYIEETISGYVSAGTGEYLTDEVSEKVQIPKNIVPRQEYDLVLQVNGDSMQPMFEDHEFVFIKKSEDIRSGQIGVFIIDGEGYLKKVYKEDSHLRLVSLNKQYSDLEFDDMNDIQLIGTVVL